MGLTVFAHPLFASVQVLLAVALFCLRAPRRPKFVLRALAVLLLYFLGTLLCALLGFELIPELTTTFSYQAQFVLQGFLPFLWIGIVLLCFDVSAPTAILLVSAGFSAYNIASGIIGTLWVLAGGMGITTDVATEIFYDIPPDMGSLEIIVQLAVTVLVYSVCYFTVVRGLDEDWSVTMSDSKVALMFVAVLLLDVVFDLSIKATYNYGVPVFHRAIFGFTKIFICIFLLFTEFQILYAGKTEARMELEQRILQERGRQYHLSRETVDAINLKCHDIRHQIRGIGRDAMRIDPRVIEDIAHEVSIYDSSVSTGNDALDTILTEKSLACGHDGVQLSVMADGSALNFMQPAELYALFGNALDNAIEAVRPLKDPGMRSISLVVCRRGSMVSVHVENYYEGFPQIVNGLPQTTKRNRAMHGFGMRSMRATVERHGGSLTCNASESLFRLDILIPIPGP